MKTLVQMLREFHRREDGPTAVEYAIMLALIIVVCVTSVTALGSNSNKSYGKVGNALPTTSS